MADISKGVLCNKITDLFLIMYVLICSQAYLLLIYMLFSLLLSLKVLLLLNLIFMHVYKLQSFWLNILSANMSFFFHK